MVVWFTGLSGAGKSTIAMLLRDELEGTGKRVAILDGDTVRAGLHRHLGFTRDDIQENNYRIAQLAKERSITYDVVLVPVISPYRTDRASARRIVGKGFIELYVHCPLAICQQRDTKGLYARAAAGAIDNLIGVSPATPYEPPEHPELEICSGEEAPAQSVERIMAILRQYA